MNLTRTFFKPSEDAMIIKWRKKRPDAPWSEIAKKIKGKTAKQCNDRYNKHLKHVRNETPWTQEEDQKLDELVGINGHNWVLISTLLGNRSNIEVKNRWTVLNRIKVKKEKGMKKQNDIVEEQAPKEPSVVKPPEILHIETASSNFFEKFEIVNNTTDLWELFDSVAPEKSEFGDFGIVPFYY